MAGEKNILLVEESELEAIRHWPIELRALFDPDADLELARQSATSPRQDSRDDDGANEIPF